VTASLLAILLIALQAAPSATLPVLALPSEPDAWVVRIETSGGYTGRGLGNYTASSSGEVECLSPTVQAACLDRLLAEAQQTLSRLVAAVPLTAQPVASPPARNGAVCNDCVTTIMTVRRREGAGERTVRYQWDETTRATIPGDVLRLHAAVIATVSPRGR
jgi:hypothetical protein